MVLIEMQRTSTILASQSPVWAALPDTLPVGTRLPTVWLLHGLGDDGSVWARKVAVEQLALQHHVAIVMPSFARSFYVNEAFGLRYGDYLEQELIPAMRGLLPLSQAADANWLVGNSMGGYGALRLALTHPTWFAGVGAMSSVTDLASLPTFMPDHETVLGPGDARCGDLQLTSLLKQAYLPAVRRLRFYMTVGTEDAFCPANEAFADALDRAGVIVDAHVDPGAHCWAYWQAHLPLVLDQLLRKTHK